MYSSVEIGGPPIIPIEDQIDIPYPTKNNSKDEDKKNINDHKVLKDRYTKAYNVLKRFLNELNNGVLKDKFICNHRISDECTIDFYFNDIRFGIIISSNINHENTKQVFKLNNISPLFLEPSEVFDEEEILTEKLRNGWRNANKLKSQKK